MPLGNSVLGDNRVEIFRKDSFPTPVAGKINLLADTLYMINGDINIGTDSLVFGNNTSVNGDDNDNDSITYTGTGDAIIMEDANSIMQKVTLNALSGNAFKILNTAGNEGTSTVTIERIICNADKAGTITNIGTADFERFTMQSADGFSMFGTQNVSLLYDKSGAQTSAGTMFDFGTSVWVLISITSTGFIIFPGVTALSSSNSGANINIAASVQSSVIINFGGTFLSGIDKDQTGWVFLDNEGQEDTAKDALQLKEVSTPTAKADIGKVYTKSDNNLFFQDGAGVEKQLATLEEVCNAYTQSKRYTLLI